MTISFTGLGSGMDYSSWIDALVEAKEANLTTLETKIEDTEAAQTTIDELESSFTSFNSTLTTFTDSNLISAFDIFGRRQVTTSDEDKTATATVSNSATIQSFELNVLQLATSTVATGNNNLGKLAVFDHTTPISADVTTIGDAFSGNITEGKLKATVNGEEKSLDISSSTKLSDVVDFLNTLGTNATLGSDGKITFTSTSEITFDTTSEGVSSLADLLNFTSQVSSYSYDSNAFGETVTDDTTLVSLDSSLEQLDELVVTVDGTKHTFKLYDSSNNKISDVTNFLKGIDGIDADSVQLDTTGKITFNSNENITFSGDIATALGFTQTPTSYTNTSDPLQLDSSSKLLDLNNGVVEKGEVSFYVNNEKKTFTVDENTTLDEFKRFLLAEGEYEDTGVGVESVDFSADGSLSFTCQEGQNVNIGTTADTSNLLDFFGFSKIYDEETGEATNTYSSSKILTTINTSGKITSTGNINLPDGITAEDLKGTFKIGNEEFTIDDNTSISGLIYQINSNSDAGVTASYDAVSNKLVLKAKDPGATTINVEAVGDCKFTDAVGWTTDGTKLASGSQNLGQNSKFKINDETFESASNTIGDDVTGITGLTLTLKQVTKDDETAQISITSDYTEVESAIDTFVEKYNELITDMKEASSSDGTLAYDSSLRRMITELSNTVMNMVSGLDTYASFSSIGISTGSATSDVSDVSQELVFDKSKFEEAMAKNPDEVKKLFVNEDKDDQSNSGVMVKLQNLVEGYDKKNEDGTTTKVPGYLTVETGYFAIKSDSYESQLETLNDSLERKQELIEEYRERLESEFQEMDSQISTMESYSSYLTSALSSS